MTFSSNKVVGLIITLLFISLAAFFVGSAPSIEREGFNTVPIKYTDANKTEVVYGYYKVNDQLMASIPYGFVIDPKDPTKILAKTIYAKYQLASDEIPPVPKNGKKMPTGFYKLNDASLAVLPPNMMPKLTSLDFTTDSSPDIIWKYGTSYISETRYYDASFIPDYYPKVLPPEVYYVDPSNLKVAVLPLGKIADKKKGYGTIIDPKIGEDYNALSNRDVSNNYNIRFHATLEDIKAQNAESDLSFGEVRVRNQNGDIIVLPKIKMQEWTTFYTPGEFKYGPATYVPNYEDSVYLSSISNAGQISSPYNYNSCASKACAAYQYVKNTLSPYCSNGGNR